MKLRDPFRFRERLLSAASPRSPRRMLQVIALESQRSRLPQMAAALSYRTIFGLLPIVVVALVALRFFVSDAQIDKFITDTLRYAGLEAIVVDAPDTELPPLDETGVSEEPEAGESPVQTPPEEEPPVVTPQEVRQSELADTIRDLVRRAKSIDYRAIGIAGVIMLIYAAISMLTEIERAFNQIFRVPIGKPWRRRLVEYWALMTLGTPCLVATFYVGERAKTIIGHTVESAGLSASGTVGIVLSGYAITVLISAVLLLLAYTILPNTRVRIVPALAGALFAAILWEAGKWGFTQYLRYSTSYAKLYGSIALIPLFLLWIYATWAIVLFGLNITYHIQQVRSRKAGAPTPVAWSEAPAGVVDPGAAVAVVHATARGFVAGKPVTLAGVVESTGVPGAVVSDILSRLVDAGILLRVQQTDDATAFALALPPDRIRIRSVLEIGYELAGPGEGEGVGSGVRARLRDTHLETAGDATIADLLNSGTGPPSDAGAANKDRPETSAADGANPCPDPYPPPSSADTLPSPSEGAQDRDQQSAQNRVSNGDPSPRPHRRPGVL